MTFILILSTFPITNPRHGGQIRTANIANKFKKNGWNVDTLSVYEEESYSKSGPLDHIFPIKTPYRLYNDQAIPLIAALQTSKFVGDPQHSANILRKLNRKYDVIYVEQPWLWPLAMRYRELVNPNTILCYGSENIESSLKKDIILSMTGQSYIKDIPSIVAEIDALEKSAAAGADFVFCVSNADKEIHKSWGVKNIAVAANGVEITAPNVASVQKWSERLGHEPFLLYVGSAHPPNFVEFAKLTGGSLGCFPPNTRLVVAGTVCEHIYRQCLDGIFSSTNIARLHLLYGLEADDLTAVKHLAHGFFLPIPHGGGTNLKTAEALISGKFIIATETALRGFEAYRDRKGLFVFDSPSAMHRSIRNVFTRTLDELSSERALPELTWEHTLNPIIDTVSRLMGAR